MTSSRVTGNLYPHPDALTPPVDAGKMAAMIGVDMDVKPFAAACL